MGWGWGIGWGTTQQNPNISYYMTRYRQQPMQMLDLLYILLLSSVPCYLIFLFSHCISFPSACGYISQIPKNMWGMHTFFFHTGFAPRKSVSHFRWDYLLWRSGWTNCCRCCCCFCCFSDSYVAFHRNTVFGCDFHFDYIIHSIFDTLPIKVIHVGGINRKKCESSQFEVYSVVGNRHK